MKISTFTRNGCLSLALLLVPACATSNLQELISMHPEPVLSEGKTVAQRFVEAFGANDPESLRAVLDDDVTFYGTLSWGLEGSENLVNFASEFQKGMPGLRIVLHDEFYNAGGTRGNFRIHLHFNNTGVFMGNPPTGKSGVSVESFTMTIDEGKITELIQSGNSFPLAAIELIDFGMEFPTETQDPYDAILSASPNSVEYFN